MRCRLTCLLAAAVFAAPAAAQNRLAGPVAPGARDSAPLSQFKNILLRR